MTKSQTNITSCEIPLLLPETLPDLNSLGISYLIYTGRAELLSPGMQLKTLLKYDGKAVPGWWPEHVLLSRAIQRAWDKHSKPLMLEIVGAFDLSDDQIKVDTKRIDKAFKKEKKLGQKVLDACAPQVARLTSLIAVKAERYWLKHGRGKDRLEKEDVDLAWNTWLSTQSANQLATFVKAHPERILHPEVERLIKIAQKSPEQRRITLDAIQQRLFNVSKQGNYWNNVSSAQASWQWNAQGVVTARLHGVKTYSIVNPLDKRTCPVCRIMHGTEYQVNKVFEQVQKQAEIPEPAALKEAFPFPRINDVDNMDRTELEKKGYSLPPYHCRCRCQIIYMGGEWTEDTSILPPVIAAPPKPKPKIAAGKKAYNQALKEGKEIYVKEKHAILYAQAKQEYASLTPKELKDVLHKGELKDIHAETIVPWRQSTTRIEPTLLKHKIKKLEGLKGDIRYDPYFEVDSYRGIVKRIKAKAKAYDWTKEKLDLILEDMGYIKLRALNQTYMEKVLKGKKIILLHRGTDGRTGPEVAYRWLDQAKTAIKRGTTWTKDTIVKVRENPLVGYSSEFKIANSFGPLSSGLMISKKVPLRDVVLHKDLLYERGASYREEAEFIIRNKTKQTKIRVRNVTLEPRGGISKERLLPEDKDPFRYSGINIKQIEEEIKKDLTNSEI